MTVKTATFKLGKYKIHEDAPLLGICDIPRKRGCKEDIGISILPGNSMKALVVVIEEAMHAEEIPDQYVHDGGSDRIGRLLWRLGWRRRVK